MIISVGGEKGAVAVNDSASAQRFADSTYALMEEYGFDGVDIDLENGLNSTYMTEALTKLHEKAGDGLVLTMRRRRSTCSRPRTSTSRRRWPRKTS